MPLASLAQDPATPRFFEPYQTPSDTPTTSGMAPGHVHVAADAKVERLMERFVAVKHPQPGFRVQIHLGSDRKVAEEIKRGYLQKNPESMAYLSWLPPNWRLRVGDCRTRLEAERLLRDLRPIYPGSYIVPDEIEMPR
ncbi:MAG: SPOR domain-containing protein [Flavobacteriales bacterium]|nr:SPOR domain-containing protein [Flavobacteriales bacterium]